MEIIHRVLNGALILKPRIFEDQRGFFCETFNQSVFDTITKSDTRFVQDNHSRSQRGVLRGLHLQTRKPQGKLVRVSQGEIFDVAVDLRKDSSTFGQWYGVHLNDTEGHQFWIPPGMAHGFLTLSMTADVQYKVTDFYDPGFEASLAWNDPDIGIEWPLGYDIQLSDKDLLGLRLNEVMAECALHTDSRNP